MKKFIFLLLFPIVLNAQINNWYGKTVEQLSNITAGVTNIASKNYWESYAYLQIYDLINYQFGLDTLTANDGTPTLTGYVHFITANTATTAITSLGSPTPASSRCLIWIHVNDAYTTFTNGATLDCGGVNLAPTTGDIMRCYYNGSKWHVSFAHIE